MWNTLFRSFAGDKPEEGYFPTVARFGQQMMAALTESGIVGLRSAGFVGRSSSSSAP